MTEHRSTGSRLRVFAGSLLVLLATVAWGQSTETEPERPDEDTDGTGMDEIVVVAEKPGDKSVETPYEELLRQRILEEYDRVAREQEELAWRQEPSLSDPSRISFGYRPQDQGRDTTRSEMNRLPMDRVKPATVFRFEF